MKIEDRLTKLPNGLWHLRTLPDDTCTLLYPSNVVNDIANLHQRRLLELKTESVNAKDLVDDLTETIVRLERTVDRHADAANQLTDQINELRTLRPIEEWHEDQGVVILWTVPVCEPPYVGTPLDADAPMDARHYTPILEPYLTTLGDIPGVPQLPETTKAPEGAKVSEENA